MWAFDLTFGLGLALAGYVLLTPARRRWTGLLGGLLLASPGLRWLVTVFGFPIRLQLSAWVGAMLRAVGADASASGNLIRLNGSDFAVDSACVGLQMTGLAVLVGLFLLVHLENRTRRYVPFGGLVVVAVGTGALLILTNLLRMLVLVWFRIGPENPLHDGVGLVCQAVYLLAPLNWGIARLYERFGKPLSEKTRVAWPRVALLYGLVGVAGFGVLHRSQPGTPARVPVPAGYAAKLLENGFRQYSKPGLLVYAKPVRTAYSAEHSPVICWKGSGYTIDRVEETSMGGRSVYIGTLQRGRERLYTAWWFTNGTCRTIGQIDFRWRMLRGEPAFTLLNVTAARPDALEEAVRIWY